MVAAIQELRPLTIEDLAEFPEDNIRREIITGELYVSPSPTFAHQMVVGRLDRLIGNWVDYHQLGITVPSPMDVRLFPNDIVQPDLVFVAAGRSNIRLGNFVDGSPNVLVEILSPSTRRVDLILKRVIYQQAGIREYWVVDLTEPSIAVLQLRDGYFVPATEVDGKLTSAVLPGLVIDPEIIFAGVGEFSDEDC
jgi:Uma2 family endonuclease